jgi:hypothetical protein
MRRLLFPTLIAAFLSSCSIPRNIEASPVGLISVDGYSETMKTDADQFHVITSEEEFNDLFVTNADAGKKPDFNGQMAISVTAHNQKFYLTKATISEKEMNVYYEIGKGSPVTIATVPKNQSVTKVNFFQDNYLVRTIDVSIR